MRVLVSRCSVCIESTHKESNTPHPLSLQEPLVKPWSEQHYLHAISTRRPLMPCDGWPFPLVNAQKRDPSPARRKEMIFENWHPAPRQRSLPRSPDHRLSRSCRKVPPFLICLGWEINSLGAFYLIIWSHYGKLRLSPIGCCACVCVCFHCISITLSAQLT